MYPMHISANREYVEMFNLTFLLVHFKTYVVTTLCLQSCYVKAQKELGWGSEKKMFWLEYQVLLPQTQPRWFIWPKITIPLPQWSLQSAQWMTSSSEIAVFINYNLSRRKYPVVSLHKCRDTILDSSVSLSRHLSSLSSPAPPDMKVRSYECNLNHEMSLWSHVL